VALAAVDSVHRSAHIAPRSGIARCDSRLRTPDVRLDRLGPSPTWEVAARRAGTGFGPPLNYIKSRLPDEEAGV